ncbi:cell surface glycoprotein CD200 receptor 1 [Tupaia chinensis]|uniref:cell surface glycoprotein CD200 receptor 1 n=1 Tax=Tupaia chinensis TaxID=246437 RepID=UPI000FFCA304|nr:cell surface glycoprotein CD200 receptor 1 [Tupaia chinensis]
MDGKEKILNNSVPPAEAFYNNSSLTTHSEYPKQKMLSAEVDIPLFVLMNSKAVLCCPPVSRTYMIGATWEIILRDKPACIKAYKADSNETKDVNCTDRRITWVSRPDQNLSLRIDPVSITHDGDYRCEVAAFEGNFQCGYRLQVLVPPEVTLVPSKNRTATCKAAGGKPAAQISWTPEGHCVTKQELLDNGTVTVRSTCHWSDSNVSAVTCSVSHLAGNKTLSEEVGPALASPDCEHKEVSGHQMVTLQLPGVDTGATEPGEEVAILHGGGVAGLAAGTLTPYVAAEPWNGQHFCRPE